MCEKRIMKTSKMCEKFIMKTSKMCRWGELTKDKRADIVLG